MTSDWLRAHLGPDKLFLAHCHMPVVVGRFPIGIDPAFNAKFVQHLFNFLSPCDFYTEMNV